MQAIEPHVRIAEEKGLTFKQEVDPALPPRLVGDTYWLEHILINLVDNAIKYTEQGGVFVRLQRQDETHWALQVEDTGIGIPEDMHDYIFQAFEQVESGPGKKIQGVGLGLSIVQQLAAALGGQISLWSQPGRGSRFTVVFPLQEAPSEA